MARDLPTRQELRRGMTVRVVQEQDNNPGEPLIGDVQTIVSDEETHPEGIKVRLQSDVTGRVKEVVTPEEEDEMTD